VPGDKPVTFSCISVKNRWTLPMFRLVKPRLRRSGVIPMLGLAILIGQGPVSAEEIALRPRYQVGDRYALDLSLDTATRVLARRGGTRNPDRDSFRENVELHYTAEVEVLETDAAGLPLRERHEEVELTSKRPEGTRELFTKGARFDLVRRGEGSVEIQFQGARVQPEIEKIVGDLLAHQTEYQLAALLDPGRSLSVGERWELDAARATQFLLARGMNDVALDGSADAVLSRKAPDALVIRYRIPIRDFGLPKLPEGSTPKDSKGSLEGEVKLDGGGLHRVRAHSSKLALDINGELSAQGKAHAGRWYLHRSQSVAQRTQTLKDQLASSH
jgi:hypothetical protein